MITAIENDEPLQDESDYLCNRYAQSCSKCAKLANYKEYGGQTDLKHYAKEAEEYPDKWPTYTIQVFALHFSKCEAELTWEKYHDVCPSEVCHRLVFTDG